MRLHNVKKVGVVALMLTSFACISDAQAVVANGHSEGAGLVLQSVFPGVSLVLPPVSDYAPAPYSNSSLILPLNPVIPGVLGLNSGTLFGSDASDVNGLPGSRSATGTGTINGTALDLLGVTLTADILSSTSSVTGDSGSFDAAGSSIIANAVLTIPQVLGTTVIQLNPAAAPNTVITNPVLTSLGIIIVLNEQLVDDVAGGSCAALSCKQETNAIHIKLNPLGLQLVDVDLKLGHSLASLTAAPVPEASEWAMMLAGVGLIGLQLRRRSGRAHIIRA